MTTPEASNEIEVVNDLERAEKLVQKAIEVRGVKVRVAEVPMARGSALRRSC